MSDQNNSFEFDSALFKKRSLFSVRQGRALRGERAEAMEALFPKLSISEEILSENHQLATADLFYKNFSEFWLEIGFGHGERLAQLCRSNKNVGYIGVEPFMNGMAAFLKDIKEDELDNIRVLMDDGMIVARSLKENSLDGIYILNPDPWHKKRHHKRRILSQKNLDVFSKIIKPGGHLIMSTDVEDLAEWMCLQASHHPDFTWTANNKANWYNAPNDWISTKYEKKGAKGAKKMIYLFFEKNK